MTEIHARDAGELAALGERLAAALFPGAVVCLRGGLGAGKTTFAQGVARGLGVFGPVPSPTFVIVAEYPEARVPLRHVDLYRLERAGEVEALGLEERVGEEGAWLVEWPGRAEELWPADRLEIELSEEGQGEERGEVPPGRRLRAHATGPRHVPLERALRGEGS